MKSEFQFIRDIKDRFGLSHVGDDCAVLAKDEVSDLLITADLLIENVDFRLKWAKPAEIGHKSLAVSLSDIAAMGGNPTSALISIGIPKNLWNSDFLDEFYGGWHRLAEEFGMEMVGGDVSSSPDGLVIDSVVMGEVQKGKAIRRSGAKVGDLIYVSGSLGGAAAGLRILEAGKDPEIDTLVQKHLRPTPQVTLGKQLMVLGVTTSMIDISDGLSSDLAHICEASRVGAVIDADLIPIDRNITGTFNDRLDLALNGGEDFELLLTIPADASDLIRELPLTRIGEVTDSGQMEIKLDGEVRELKPQGFRHF